MLVTTEPTSTQEVQLLNSPVGVAVSVGGRVIGVGGLLAIVAAMSMGTPNEDGTTRLPVMGLLGVPLRGG